MAENDILLIFFRKFDEQAIVLAYTRLLVFML